MLTVPGRFALKGSQSYRDLVYLYCYRLIWRRRWHPTPVLLPGKSHGRRSPVGCSSWDREDWDMTERLPFHFSLSHIGEGNGNPLQCSCLENPRDREAWWSMGWHRVGHDWSDAAAAAASISIETSTGDLTGIAFSLLTNLGEVDTLLNFIIHWYVFFCLFRFSLIGFTTVS